MMEYFTISLPARDRVANRAHIGVVGSGDLELLLEPNEENEAIVAVTTKVSGHRATWEAVIKRFFERHPFAVRIEIRDSGATPGAVWLRLEQGIELACKDCNHD
ncbi:malonate decarboxylase delta subunit [Granulicella rosea]|uniref:Malonate decarboxylase acyl carrier protein n=1 Tax=Granulicella rosea TaxID=474952 RepID=A0A239EEY0_9BACT|nr:malonate decarboxylase acyl carrier protein [Granulicella rosea]SNS43340.1 malonate decarboxylase delta subunit [Granulicella rosea]